MSCEVSAAAGAAAVAALNEVRAWLRARQADKDRAESLRAAHKAGYRAGHASEDG